MYLCTLDRDLAKKISAMTNTIKIAVYACFHQQILPQFKAVAIVRNAKEIYFCQNCIHL